MERSVGPACPRCGCQDSAIIRRPADGESKWFQRQHGRAQCRNCGLRFQIASIDEPKIISPPIHAAMPDIEHHEPIIDSERANGVIYYQQILCPECGSKNTKVARKMPDKEGIPTIRYHKCRACEASFKSVERVSG